MSTRGNDYARRSSEVLMHTYKRIALSFSYGEGVRLYDEEGKEYLDFLAGIAVNSLGYRHPALTKAVVEQAEKLWHCSNLFEIPSQIALAEKLVALSDFSKVFFCNSGTEANEAAIKLARKHGKLNGGGGTIVAMQKSFHGRSMGSLSVTGQAKYRRDFAPLIDDVGFVPFNDCTALEETVDEDTCAVIIEPIQGEGGIHPADSEFLHKARELCSRNNALLIFDEVQCGLGRTGELFAYSHSAVVPDVVTLAKGLGGGFPIGAVLAGEEAAVFEPGDHAATFGGNPMATTAGLAVIEELGENGLIGHVGDVSDYLHKKLHTLSERSSKIREIRGKGLMIGIELSEPAGPLMQSCLDRGLIVGKAGDTVLRLVPPLVIEKEDVDTAIEVLEELLA